MLKRRRHFALQERGDRLWKSLGGLVYEFALAPSDILVLVLVVVMGMLGSSLQLSYIYVSEYAARPVTRFSLMPAVRVETLQSILTSFHFWALFLGCFRSARSKPYVSSAPIIFVRATANR
jgi:hypothetical protein